MPIPEFIRDLRAHVGHAPLWLSGVSGVVVDDSGRVLLTHRADTEEWAVVSGVLEPGEEPAHAIVREIAEETGITAAVDRLTSIDVTPMITYPNGDQTQYLDVCFLARHVDGEPRVATTRTSRWPGFPPTICRSRSRRRHVSVWPAPSTGTNAPGSVAEVDLAEVNVLRSMSLRSTSPSEYRAARVSLNRTWPIPRTPTPQTPTTTPSTSTPPR